jgi:hypothetical protein
LVNHHKEKDNIRTTNSEQQLIPIKRKEAYSKFEQSKSRTNLRGALRHHVSHKSHGSVKINKNIVCQQFFDCGKNQKIKAASRKDFSFEMK